MFTVYRTLILYRFFYYNFLKQILHLILVGCFMLLSHCERSKCNSCADGYGFYDAAAAIGCLATPYLSFSNLER